MPRAEDCSRMAEGFALGGRQENVLEGRMDEDRRWAYCTVVSVGHTLDDGEEWQIFPVVRFVWRPPPVKRDTKGGFLRRIFQVFFFWRGGGGHFHSPKNVLAS